MADSSAMVPREQYDRVIACLDQAVAALDIATDALAAGTKIAERAVLTAKLAEATRDLRAAVGEAVAADRGTPAADICEHKRIVNYTRPDGTTRCADCGEVVEKPTPSRDVPPAAERDWFREVWDALTDNERNRLRAKAQWEHMTLSGVMREWPSLVPDSLRDLVPKPEPTL